MSYLVGKLEDRFSSDADHLMLMYNGGEQTWPLVRKSTRENSFQIHQDLIFNTGNSGE